MATSIVHAMPIVVLDGLEGSYAGRVRERLELLRQLGTTVITTDEECDSIPRVNWPEPPPIAHFEASSELGTSAERSALHAPPLPSNGSAVGAPLPHTGAGLPASGSPMSCPSCGVGLALVVRDGGGSPATSPAAHQQPSNGRPSNGQPAAPSVQESNFGASPIPVGGARNGAPDPTPDPTPAPTPAHARQTNRFDAPALMPNEDEDDADGSGTELLDVAFGEESREAPAPSAPQPLLTPSSVSPEVDPFEDSAEFDPGADDLDAALEAAPPPVPLASDDADPFAELDDSNAGNFGTQSGLSDPNPPSDPGSFLDDSAEDLLGDDALDPLSDLSARRKSQRHQAINPAASASNADSLLSDDPPSGLGDDPFDDPTFSPPPSAREPDPFDDSIGLSTLDDDDVRTVQPSGADPFADAADPFADSGDLPTLDEPTLNGPSAPKPPSRSHSSGAQRKADPFEDDLEDRGFLEDSVDIEARRQGDAPSPARFDLDDSADDSDDRVPSFLQNSDEDDDFRRELLANKDDSDELDSFDDDDDLLGLEPPSNPRARGPMRPEDSFERDLDDLLDEDDEPAPEPRARGSRGRDLDDLDDLDAPPAKRSSGSASRARSLSSEPDLDEVMDLFGSEDGVPLDDGRGLDPEPLDLSPSAARREKPRSTDPFGDDDMSDILEPLDANEALDILKTQRKPPSDAAPTSKRSSGRQPSNRAPSSLEPLDPNEAFAILANDDPTPRSKHKKSRGVPFAASDEDLLFEDSGRRPRNGARSEPARRDPTETRREPRRSRNGGPSTDTQTRKRSSKRSGRQTARPERTSRRARATRTPPKGGPGDHGLVLSRINDPSKKDKAAELIASIKGCSMDEAVRLTERTIIPVLKNVTREEAEHHLESFKEHQIAGRVTTRQRN